MLDSAISHPKLKRLSRELRIPLPYAVGVMQMLWIFTKDHYPAGDIGKAEDIDIEESVQWPAERSGELIPALLKARLVDQSAGLRLIVHDWPEHCGPFTHAKMFRLRRCFADRSVPKPRLQDLKESERKAFSEWEAKVHGTLGESPLDNRRKSTEEVKLDEVKLDETSSGVQNLLGSEPPEDPDPSPPPRPSGQPIPIRKPKPRSGDMRRIRSEDFPKPPDSPEAEAVAEILSDFGEWGKQLPPPDPDLVAVIAGELNRAGLEPSALVEMLKPRRDSIRNAKCWGLVITIVESRCRGIPLRPKSPKNEFGRDVFM